MEMPLSVEKVVYQDILDSTTEPNISSSWKNKVDPILEPIWVAQSSCSHDCHNDTLPSDEAILEAIFGPNRCWDNMHHRSYFLLELVKITHDPDACRWNSTYSNWLVLAVFS
jgi:hypothetical protein